MTRAARAFTLIELLVVVAVIAILAALALPSFLHAQTRAKMARAKADIRTIVTALESYRVDANNYPTYHYLASSINEFHVGGRVPAWPQPDPLWDGRNPLTTPVAYITTMPQDPFHIRSTGNSEEREYLYVNWDYAVTLSGVPSGLLPAFVQARDIYGSYRLHSLGPDTKGPDTGIPYDPTNGTTSVGDITYGPRANFDNLYTPVQVGS